MIDKSAESAIQHLRLKLIPADHRYHQWVVGRRLNRYADHLERMGVPFAELLGSALRATTSAPTEGEARLTRRIEALRRDLLKSDATVPRWSNGDSAPKKVTPVRVLVRRMSKQPIWGRLLLHLVRVTRPQHALELGSAFGLSAAYQAAGLQLGSRGTLTTIEGNPALAKATAANLERVGFDPFVEVVQGTFAAVLPDVLEGGERVGYAFVDGHHDEAATISYFRQIAMHMEPPGVMVFDDIRWSAGMRRAWREIASDGAVDLAVDLGSLGVCRVTT